MHGFFVYESTLHVPLIFRGPGIVPGLRLKPTVRTIDLLPTVLDLLGVNRVASLRTEGRSLALALRAAGRLEDASTVRRVSDAAAALWLERPPRHPGRSMEVHPGAEARAVRP